MRCFLVNTHFPVAQSILLQLVVNSIKTFLKVVLKKNGRFQTLTKEKEISLHVQL